MTMENSQKFILPTLASNFNLAISEILNRMNSDSLGEQWRAMVTLYHILPPAIYDKVKGDYEKITKKINHVGNSGSISYIDLVQDNDEVNAILEEFASPFFRKMYELLYEGGYLEKKPRDVPIGNE